MLTRRHLLGSGAGAVAAFALPGLGRAAPRTTIEATRRTIEVAGRAAEVFGLVQTDGTHGLSLAGGERFSVELVNRLAEPTLVHWHGLTPPYRQDGVPDLSQPPLSPGGRYGYDFAVTRPGTYWMHSHLGLQEQQLLAAPLIVHDPADAGRDEQEVVVLLHDFTFRDPAEILAGLTRGETAPVGSGDAGQMGMAGMDHGAGMAAMDHGAMAGMQQDDAGMAGMDHGGMAAGNADHAMQMDLNDVAFDAFLANDRTLDDPEVVRVEPGARVRLRVINAATATNFHLDLGQLAGTLIAVDGQPVEPVRGSSFEIAMAQRLDVQLELPAGGGSHPILARREGDRSRTGIVLASAGAAVRRLDTQADTVAPPVGLDLERRLRSTRSRPLRPADRTLTVDLTGDMAAYVWTLNGARFGEHAPLRVAEGERVEMVLRNRTMMSHPMHLHGHHFQVVALDGVRLPGAVRDTVLVPIEGSVTIAFEADNPGRWPFHCHNLYHMAAGMMTSVEYEGLPT